MTTTLTPEPKIETIVSFTIPRVDWFGLLGDVLPFASDDDRLPTLTVVAVHIDGKRITVRATDRFTFGRAWYEGDGDVSTVGPVKALIPVGAIKAAEKLHTAHRRGLPQKELRIKLRVIESAEFQFNASIDTGDITIESGGLFDAKVTSVQKLYSGPFVDIDHLVPEEFVDTGEIHWNPELMAKFGRVRRPQRDAIQVRFSGKNRPIRIDIGPQFTGCIMPARKPGER